MMSSYRELLKVHHTELLGGVSKQFLGTSRKLLEEAPREALE